MLSLRFRVHTPIWRVATAAIEPKVIYGFIQSNEYDGDPVNCYFFSEGNSFLCKFYDHNSGAVAQFNIYLQSVFYKKDEKSVNGTNVFSVFHSEKVSMNFAGFSKYFRL